ncbi:hypothetical protein RHSIM_Rhsim07G0029200 [Rhododendron simsii]|uniref:Uncharacterized protein n=1 Tax=Rhododendron simsii TaxID=118357 RepID=A0A834GSM2_RHOSS|nr:hypothetical protein RHSIM_Rhsim07G0029200 [Rhododendron simsii]
MHMVLPPTSDLSRSTPVLLLTAVCDCSILYESALGMKLLVTALGICTLEAVEKVFGASPPDILEIEKAKKMLMCGGIGTAMLVSGEFSAQSMNRLSATIKIKQSSEGMQYGVSPFFHSPTATLLFALVLLLCSLGSKRENGAHVC